MLDSVAIINVCHSNSVLGAVLLIDFCFGGHYAAC